MNVSAVNCTPIKPQVAFQRKIDSDDYNSTKSATDESKTDKIFDTDNYKSVKSATDKIFDTYIKSSDIKKPLAIAGSIGLVFLCAFAGGKAIASQVATICPQLPQTFEKGLKSVHGKVKNVVASLTKEVENPTKKDKLKNLAGKTLDKTDDAAKSMYKKLSKMGILKKAENSVDDAIKKAESSVDDATRAFTNISGLASVATVVPPILGKDSDDNGVNDILEKTQNAYTGKKVNIDQKLGLLSGIADILSLFV